MRHWQGTALAIVSFLLVAIVATWPLSAQLTTHLPGEPSGDTGVYVWNLWNFRHELVDLGRNPLSTSSVFSLTPRPNLSTHNYTALADVFALPLLPVLGPVATYNLLLIALVAANGWAAWLLIRHLTGRTAESWVAGVLFALSPALMARTTAHFSLVAAFPLPLILLATIKGLDSGARKYAAGTGALIAAAGFCDPYYAIYGALLSGGVAICQLGHWQWSRRPIQRPLVHALDLAAAIALALVFLIVASGGGTFDVLGVRVAMKTLYTPVLIVTVLAAMRLLASWKLRVSLSHVPQALRFAAIAIAICLTGLSPTLYGMGKRYAEGRFDSQVTLWRSSPPGVDLLSFVLPNPVNPWVGPSVRDWLTYGRSDGFAEFTAALPFTALLLIAWIGFRRRSLPGTWCALTAVFGLLALGPFIHIGGVNTHIPGPWALLRYVPVLEWARSPSRFAIPLALLVSVLFAHALVQLRQTARRGTIAAVLLCGVLFVELLPAPRLLASAAVPSVFDTVRADPDTRLRVLELPTGIRDGTSSLGNFSAAAQFRQTYHGKRLVGGYLSRVSKRRKREHLSFPVFSVLVALSEGREPTPEQERLAWQQRGTFLRRSRIGYVVFDSTRASPALKRFAVALFDLQPVEQADGIELYRPRTPLIAGLSPESASAKLESVR
ncbi:MAG: hypothetical protein AB7I50_10620 [Vicinamibacterales bacterium]